MCNLQLFIVFISLMVWFILVFLLWSVLGGLHWTTLSLLLYIYLYPYIHPSIYLSRERERERERERMRELTVTKCCPWEPLPFYEPPNLSCTPNWVVWNWCLFVLCFPACCPLSCWSGLGIEWHHKNHWKHSCKLILFYMVFWYSTLFVVIGWYPEVDIALSLLWLVDIQKLNVP